MRLSELTGIAPFELVRDSEFESLGLLSHDAPRMLVVLYDAKFLRRELLKNDRVACVIAPRELAPAIPGSLGLAVAEDPRGCFYEIHDHLWRHTDFYWSDFDSEISPEARVHAAACVAPRNVRIGRGTVIEPNVTVLEHCLIGEGVVLRAGSVIGAEGFDPKAFGDTVRIIPHAGGVAIRDRVEIQANSVVCRCVFRGFTEIGEDTKISTLVNVSHNVRIGKRCRIASGACLMGSARIGNDVWIGPNATISNQIRVGDGAAVSLGAVVVRDVPAGQRVSGNFAVEHRRFLASFRNLLR
jgi:acetyltransferase-like isoleucine patch superfamily enzyme